MGFKISGMDELQKEIRNMQKNVERVKRKYAGAQVSFNSLFTSKFMAAHTKAHYTDFDAWISAGRFRVESQEDFDSIPVPTLSRYVRRSTDFYTWQDMLDTAGAELLQRELD